MFAHGPFVLMPMYGPVIAAILGCYQHSAVSLLGNEWLVLTQSGIDHKKMEGEVLLWKRERLIIG